MAEASVAVKVPLGAPAAIAQVVWPLASTPIGSAVMGTPPPKTLDGMYRDIAAAWTSAILCQL